MSAIMILINTQLNNISIYNQILMSPLVAKVELSGYLFI